MSTAAGVSLDDYLSTHYEPECELIGGQLISKPMGTEDHSSIQTRLVVALFRFEAAGKLKVGTEISFRQGNEVRIPDVALYRRGARLYRRILDEPPLLCAEIVSPSQNPSELFAKCANYHAWGVPFCWVLDPIHQAAWEFHAGAQVEPVMARLHAGEIEVSLDELFDQE